METTVIPKIKHELDHNIPITDIKAAFDILKTCFGENWLNKNQDNPIQSLWSRDDHLAEIELYSLGNSLITIKNKKTNWIKEKIKRIKSGDSGAIFEILAAAMFEKGKNHKVSFPPGDNPGYDLTVIFDDKAKMNVSCKNHRKSNHNQRFDDASKKFEKRFVYLCNCLRINIQCNIVSKIYPEEHPHWDTLNRYISDLLLQYVVIDGIPNVSKVYHLDNWNIRIFAISEFEKVFLI